MYVCMCLYIYIYVLQNKATHEWCNHCDIYYYGNVLPVSDCTLYVLYVSSSVENKKNYHDIQYFDRNAYNYKWLSCLKCQL